MRPTVPLGEWRIAVDLAATSEIQNQPGTPAYGCACKWCSNWKAAESSALPEDLRVQLLRLRIDLAHPTDLYAYEETSIGARCRVIYHVVGKILSGPNVWREDPVLDTMCMYSLVGSSTQQVSLAAFPSRQSFHVRPKRIGGGEEDILQVDMRLHVPFVLGTDWEHDQAASLRSNPSYMDSPSTARN
jgi:hypothetical protein